MSNGSTGEVSVIEFRSAIQELLHSRIQEAITITLEEELAEALGCGPYERNGSRCLSTRMRRWSRVISEHSRGWQAC